MENKTYENKLKIQYLVKELQTKYNLPNHVCKSYLDHLDSLRLQAPETCPVCQRSVDDCECGSCQSHLGRGGELDE